MNDSNQTRPNCIAKMQAEEITILDTIRDTYKEMLNKGQILPSVAFTPHDYDRHSMNLYEIAFDYVFSDTIYDTLFKSSPGLLLAFNVAVILHDLSMVDRTAKRGEHQLESIKLIKAAREDTSNPISKLDENVYDAVVRLILAHSDVKDAGGEIIRKTLEEAVRDLLDIGQPGTAVMCCLFRLVDELDVTSKRISNPHLLQLRNIVAAYESNPLSEKVTDEGAFEVLYTTPGQDVRGKFHLDSASDSDLATLYEGVIAKGSLKHWEACAYIENIENSGSPGNDLILLVDGDKLSILDDADKREVLSILSNKQKNLGDKLRVEIFSHLEYKFEACLTLDEIRKPINRVVMYVVDGNERVLIEEYKAQFETEFNYKEKPYSEDTIDSVTLIKSKTTGALTNFVKQNKLFVAGHYKIEDGRCARDFILLEGIFENMEMVNHIIKSIYVHIKHSHLSSAHNNSDSLYFVGLGFNGMLMASRLAFMHGSPFSFLMPEQNTELCSDKEKDIALLPNRNVILLCDCIISFSLYNKYKTALTRDGRSVIAAYSVFYRKPINGDGVTVNFGFPNYALNADFEVELGDSKNCKHLASGNCINSIPVLT